MSQQLISEAQVKNALGIETFRNISKNKIMKFASLIPNMDSQKDVIEAYKKILDDFGEKMRFLLKRELQLQKA